MGDEKQGKILVVDDDVSMGSSVKDYLEFQGYEVDYYSDARVAKPIMFGNTSYNLVILDWDLQVDSGVDICREYRNRGGLTPVLMMTGRAAIDDKEHGLDAGADDYLTKPFSIRELAARVKSLLRRTQNYTKPAAAAPPESEGIAKPGAIVGGKYRLDSLLGKGSTAIIWRATDMQMGRSVVVKLAMEDMVGDTPSMKRFEHECRAIARIRHPNVVQIYDTGIFNNRLPFLVMELIEGDSLAGILNDISFLSARSTINIMLQVCAGLHETHMAGIIHRDLKPENIIVNEQRDRIDAVKIVDFGIARLNDNKERLTRDGMIVGSMGYISPEQLTDQAVDHRADIYAMGVIMFELISGDLPLQGDSMHAVITKILNTKPPLISSVTKQIPKGAMVEQVIERCLRKNPENRFQSVLELRDALRSAVAQIPKHLS